MFLTPPQGRLIRQFLLIITLFDHFVTLATVRISVDNKDPGRLI